MPEAQIPLIKGDKVGLDADYGDNLLVNMIAVNRPTHGVPGYIRTHSGLVEYTTAFGNDRGAVYNERFNNHYRVSGNQVVSLGEDKVARRIVEVSGNKQVSLPYSFNTQGVVADGRFWIIFPNGESQEVTDSDLGSPIDGVWIDGFYLFTDGEFLFHTQLNDETSIDPLTFATAEIQPDQTLAVDRDFDNQLMAFGRYTIEYFSNTASANFAFTRIPGRAKTIGVVGTHAKTRIAGNWLILGGRKEESTTAYLFSVSTTIRVASREVDKIITSYTETELADAILETRQEKDIEIAIIHLPRHTLVFNHTIYQQFGTDSSWSIIRDDIVNSGDWPAINGVYDPRVSKWIYGDKNSNRIGELDFNIASIYGKAVESICFTPFLNLKEASIDKIEIETIPGQITDDMTMFLSMSMNGITFGKEYIMPYSQSYDYTLRFERYRIGYITDWATLKLRGVSEGTYALAFARIDYA